MRTAPLAASVLALGCSLVVEPRVQIDDPVGDASPAIDGEAADASVDDAGRPVDDMVSLAEASFEMGCAGQPSDLQCYADESPLHTVSISAFEMDRKEVSQEEYALCVAAGACLAPLVLTWHPQSTPKWPVGGVNREMARTYCAWVGKRLPTEAEWERAARGTDDTRKFPWGNAPDPFVDCDSSIVQYAQVDCTFDLLNSPLPGGSLPLGQSPEGLEDMGGNMWEWVADRYAADYYSVSPGSDPIGPASGTLGIVRGGSYLTGESRYVRVSNRNNVAATDLSETYGFRCAR